MFYYQNTKGKAIKKEIKSPNLAVEELRYMNLIDSQNGVT